MLCPTSGMICRQGSLEKQNVNNGKRRKGNWLLNMDTLTALKEKIQSLETERNRLSNEVDALRKAVEARAAALERDVNQMREEAHMLQEILGTNEKANFSFASSTTPVAAPAVIPPPTPVVPPPTAPAAAPAPNPEVETPPDLSAKVNVAEQASFDEEEELVLKNLSADERKIVNVLLGHGGRYSQKNLRVEAGLSWLQANRIVSHLSERGVVALERSGGAIDVILKDLPE